jgi:predicted phage terminase large subunit-like protein
MRREPELLTALEQKTLDGLGLIESSPKVEEFLNTIDYSEDAQYVPSTFALEFINTIKLINENGEENQTPVVHYRMLDTIVSKERRIANLCARGMAKTTLTEYLFLYLALYGHLPGFGAINLAIYVSDSVENGVKNMRLNLQHRWENSPFLQKYVPFTRFTDVRWEFRNLDGHRLVVKGYGARTGVRGTKEMGVRPQLAVLDDLISDEDARSDTVIAAVEDTVHKAVTYALHPRQNLIIWSGTPFNARDPLYKAIESGAWTVNVFPICETFPCARADFRSAWPDRFTYDYVATEYRRALALGRVDTFNQELLLRIMSEEERMVQTADIQWYRHELVLQHKERFNFYLTTDLATSIKQRADYSVISVWAYNNNGDWFWVDGVLERQLINMSLDDLFRFVVKYKPMQVGIEVSGQQQGLVSWIQEQMLVRNTFFTLASDQNSGLPGIRPNTNKLVRFNSVLPLFKAKKIFFPNEKKNDPILLEAMNELSLIAVSGMRAKHDDFIDTVSMLGSLTPWKPSEAQPMRPEEDQIWGAEPEPELESRLSSYIV